MFAPVILQDCEGKFLQVPREAATQSDFIANQLAINSCDDSFDALVPGASAVCLSAVLQLTGEELAALPKCQLTPNINAAHYLGLTDVATKLLKVWESLYLETFTVGEQRLLSLSESKRLRENALKHFAMQIATCLLRNQDCTSMLVYVLPRPLSRTARRHQATLTLSEKVLRKHRESRTWPQKLEDLKDHLFFGKLSSATDYIKFCRKWRWALFVLSLTDARRSRVYVVTCRPGSHVCSRKYSPIFIMDSLLYGPPKPEPELSSELCLDTLPPACLQSVVEVSAQLGHQSLLLAGTIRRGRPDHFHEVGQRVIAPPARSGRVVKLAGLHSSWMRLNGALATVVSEDQQHFVVDVLVANVADSEGFSVWMKDRNALKRGRIVVQRSNAVSHHRVPACWKIIWDARRLCNMFWKPSTSAVTRVEPIEQLKPDTILRSAFGSLNTTVDCAGQWLFALIGAGISFSDAAEMLEMAGFKSVVQAFQLESFANPLLYRLRLWVPPCVFFAGVGGVQALPHEGWRVDSDCSCCMKPYGLQDNCCGNGLRKAVLMRLGESDNHVDTRRLSFHSIHHNVAFDPFVDYLHRPFPLDECA